ncbi:ATP-binding protein [Streptomyces sp. NPDC005479]|uniref:ATP-binding protein n=1 Tax=Streptomyces sp. NPDC005479 TaxID=3154879 RepID=UPI0033B811D5
MGAPTAPPTSISPTRPAQSRSPSATTAPASPPDQRHAMKDRFTRGPRTRAPGSGLGLALVEQQAPLHGGTLRLGRSPSGGLQAAFTIPAPSQDPPADERTWPRLLTNGRFCE